jgi:hypothetical protein
MIEIRTVRSPVGRISYFRFYAPLVRRSFKLKNKFVETVFLGIHKSEVKEQTNEFRVVSDKTFRGLFGEKTLFMEVKYYFTQFRYNFDLFLILSR